MKKDSMRFFNIRSRRIPVEVEVRVSLQDKITMKTSAHSVCGTIISLSKTGASLILPTMILDREHLFFTTQENGANLLLPTIIHNEVIPHDLSGISIWMNSVVHHEKSCFAIGMRFAQRQKELFLHYKKNSSAASSPASI